MVAKTLLAMLSALESDIRDEDMSINSKLSSLLDAVVCYMRVVEKFTA